MRVAFVACSAPARTAVGNLLAEKVAFFLDRGAEVRVFLESIAGLHPQILPHAEVCDAVPTAGPAWDYLSQSDVVFFEFSQGFELLHLLPLLADEKPRLIATYYGLSPSAGWPGPQRELLERGQRDRGLLWCADAVIVHSQFARDELMLATALPASRFHLLKVPIDLARWQQAAPSRGAGSEDRTRRQKLLFVGRLALNKRLPLVIEALAHLPDAEAWIVGNDRDIYADQARQARQLADKLGVADRVRWRGDVADDALPELYRRADVLVLPSIHEGLGIPVLEAQAAGLPVVAARAAALPETIADAGLTFRPDDVDDFVRQLRRIVGQVSNLSQSPPESSNTDSTGQVGILPYKRRIALVAFRFGSGFVGGAETSLRNIGHALLRQGYSVEVFTTCTIRESDWKNDLPPGDTTEDGFLVHRFPIDAHHRPRHDAAFRAILESNGNVATAMETEYLAHSIQSSALIAALEKANPDAIITGPYLHGLTYRVAETFPAKTLLLPCFHDEPAARLRSWLGAYTSVAGLLYHTPEEQEFAQTTLGLNHPGARLIGTRLPAAPTCDKTPSGVRTLGYCGRYSIQKNVPLLLEYASRYQAERPDRFTWVFMGEGDVRPPAAPWLRDLGRVADADKNRVLAQANALVQLSTQESLSLVVLEAWQQATPVIVHDGARVLVGQVARSGGGGAIGDYDAFAKALDDLWANPDAWQERGRNGRRYVRDNYLDPDNFARRLSEALDNMAVPLAEQMRRRGRLRVQSWDRPQWREQFGQFVEQVLDAPLRSVKRDLLLEPMSTQIAVSTKQASLLLPLRIHNRGTIPAIAAGPAATVIEVTMRDLETGETLQPVRSIALADMTLPNRIGMTLLPIDLPQRAGRWTLSLQVAGAPDAIAIVLDAADGPGQRTYDGGVAPLLEAVESALARAHAMQSLPRDYLDVCEGRFARAKRWLKQKLLNNFKRAYVDVLSSQQSEVNRRLVESVRQLTECCRALDQTVRVLQNRITELSRAEPRRVGFQPAQPAESTPRIDAFRELGQVGNLPYEDSEPVSSSS